MALKEDKLFTAFVSNDCKNLKLYNEIKEILLEELVDARGCENGDFYNILVDLMNSENNANWEVRHDKRIALLRKSMSDISDDYEEYLS